MSRSTPILGNGGADGYEVGVLLGAGIGDVVLRIIVAGICLYVGERVECCVVGGRVLEGIPVGINVRLDDVGIKLGIGVGNCN